MEAYRALSLFQPSNFAKAIEDTVDNSSKPRKYLFGSVLTFPSAVVARTVAVLGHDFVLIDAQHSAVNGETLVQLVQIVNLASQGKTVAIVRVTSPDDTLLTHALDAGAAGIIFPHIDTAEEAVKAVEKTRYAYSDGERSLSPSALIAGATDEPQDGLSRELRIGILHYNTNMQTAIQNLEAIAAVPGVNALMLGPSDLRVSLGLPSKPKGTVNDFKFSAAVERLISVGQKYRKPLMTPAWKITSGNSWISKFSLLLTSVDMYAVRDGHRQDIKGIKDRLSDAHKEREDS